MIDGRGLYFRGLPGSLVRRHRSKDWLRPDKAELNEQGLAAMPGVPVWVSRSFYGEYINAVFNRVGVAYMDRSSERTGIMPTVEV